MMSHGQSSEEGKRYSFPFRIDVKPKTKNINLAPYVEYTIDEQNQLSFNDVLTNNLGTGTRWLYSQENNFNFGFDERTYWYRFSLHNTSTEKITRIYEIGYALLDEVDVYISLPGKHGSRLTKDYEFLGLGDIRPFNERPISHRNFLIPIELNAKSDKSIFLRVKTTSSHQVPMALVKELELLHQTQGDDLFYGIYFGMMLVMIFYNSFLFLMTRDHRYVFYISFVVFVSLIQGSISGFTYQYLWPNSPMFQQICVPFFIGAAVASFGIFTLVFLNLKKYSYFLHNLIISFVGISVLTAVFSYFIGLSSAVKIEAFIATATALFSMFAGFYCWANGFRAASYFSFAFLTLCVGAMLTASEKLGVLPSIFITSHGMLIGSATEIVLLSFALGYRIRILTAEKEEALSMASSKLEEKVRIRTKALDAAMLALENANKKLSQQSQEDELTQLLNRRAFNEMIEQEWNRCLKEGKGLSIILLDIDHFKRFNDNYGHQIGDECLQTVADIISESITLPAGNAFRYGGEEFVVMLPDITVEQAYDVAQAIRQTIEEYSFMVDNQRVSITASLGISHGPQRIEDDWTACVKQADDALYMAKAKGRNCVIKHGKS